jgi:hypothetical protein
MLPSNLTPMQHFSVYKVVLFIYKISVSNGLCGLQLKVPVFGGK